MPEPNPATDCDRQGNIAPQTGPEPATPARRAWLPEKGMRVLLRQPHPWAGHTGTVVRHETWQGRPSCVVQLDDGMTAGVTRPEEYREAPDD